MIGKFLFKVIGMALLMINEVASLPNLPVTVATDWWMLGLQLVIAILSFGGTLLGVFLGIRLSMESFYKQKEYERKFVVYEKLAYLIYKSYQHLHGYGILRSNDEGIDERSISEQSAQDYWEIVSYMTDNVMWISLDIFKSVRKFHWYENSEYLDSMPIAAQEELKQAYTNAINLIDKELGISSSEKIGLD